MNDFLLDAAAVVDACHGFGRISAERVKRRLEIAYKETVEVDFLADASLEIFVCHFRDTAKVFVCFQGSRTLSDWLVNLDFFFVRKNTPARWHRGFWNLHQSSGQSLFEELLIVLETRDALDSAILCGHSQGGTMAQLMARDLAIETESKVKVVSFGAACVGDCLAAKELRLYVDHYRVQNFMDFVTWINRFIPVQNARHFGQVFWFDEHETLHIEDDDFQPVTLRRIWKACTSLSRQNLFLSHAPWIYHGLVAKTEADWKK